jgi:FtsP/CotA-like multicopper oxidase with cupredoxin domain
VKFLIANCIFDSVKAKNKSADKFKPPETFQTSRARIFAPVASLRFNGRSMDMDRIDERVPLGSVEIWEIQNRTTLAHPFHIHDVQFRVLDRDGAPPQPHELGLKDTVLIDSGSRLRVIAEFADFADPDRPYMYHCHNLEHEDAGMMGQFVVI